MATLVVEEAELENSPFEKMSTEKNLCKKSFIALRGGMSVPKI